MSERLMIGLSLSVVVHLIAFLVLGQLIDLEGRPERIGPMLVQLAEVPVPAVVREEPSEEPSSPRPQPAAAAATPSAAAAPAQPAQPAPAGARPRVAPGVPTPRPQPEQQALPRTSSSAQPRPLPAEPTGTEPVPGLKGPLPVQPAYDQPVTVPRDQPVRPEIGAAAPGVLDMPRVDSALSAGAAAGGTATSAGAAAPGGTSGASSGVSSSAAPGDYSIEWARPEQGRETISTPAPTVPAWVSREGLRLQVAVSFLLTADGLLREVQVERSSGYSDVDSAVLEALRRWSFRPAPGSRDVSGRVRYSIIPR